MRNDTGRNYSVAHAHEDQEDHRKGRASTVRKFRNVEKPRGPYATKPSDALPRSLTDFSKLARPGNNKSQISHQASEGTYDPDVLEFINAVDAAKKAAGRFLKTSEIFQVVLSLGYHK